MTPTVPHNHEWEIDELAKTLAETLERSSRQAALKSQLQPKTFHVQTISLALGVTMRRSASGKLLFSSATPAESGQTVLRLDFAQAPSENKSETLAAGQHPASIPVAQLPGAIMQIVDSLESAGVRTLQQIETLASQPDGLRELAAITAVPEALLRQWVDMPYIASLQASALASSWRIVTEGKHFGEQTAETSAVFFHGQRLQIESWCDNKVVALTEHVMHGEGPLMLVTSNGPTNTVALRIDCAEPSINDLTMSPPAALAGENLTFRASVTNIGNAPTPTPFHARWTVDGIPAMEAMHGVLAPGQTSDDCAVRTQIALDAGEHVVQFSIAPDSNDKTNPPWKCQTLTRHVAVRTPLRLTICDHRGLETLDPLRCNYMRFIDTFGLIYRGLLTWDQNRQTVVPDVAAAFRTEIDNKARRWRAVFDISPAARFHDGSGVTAEDVAFTYGLMKQTPMWESLLSHARMDIHIPSPMTVALLFDAARVPPIDTFPSLFSAPILPRTSYTEKPRQFGRAPIGCGPFRVKTFDGERLLLHAADTYHRGRPRLDEIAIERAPTDTILERIHSAAIDVALLPDDATIESEIAPLADWHITGRAAGLVAQHKRLRERAAVAEDPTWNAHLWFIA